MRLVSFLFRVWEEGSYTQLLSFSDLFDQLPPEVKLKLHQRARFPGMTHEEISEGLSRALVWARKETWKRTPEGLINERVYRVDWTLPIYLKRQVNVGLTSGVETLVLTLGGFPAECFPEGAELAFEARRQTISGRFSLAGEIVGPVIWTPRQR